MADDDEGSPDSPESGSPIVWAPVVAFGSLAQELSASLQSDYYYPGGETANFHKSKGSLVANKDGTSTYTYKGTDTETKFPTDGLEASGATKTTAADGTVSYTFANKRVLTYTHNSDGTVSFSDTDATATLAQRYPQSDFETSPGVAGSSVGVVSRMESGIVIKADAIGMGANHAKQMLDFEGWDHSAIKYENGIRYTQATIDPYARERTITIGPGVTHGVQLGVWYSDAQIFEMKAQEHVKEQLAVADFDIDVKAALYQSGKITKAEAENPSISGLSPGVRDAALSAAYNLGTGQKSDPKAGFWAIVHDPNIIGPNGVNGEVLQKRLQAYVHGNGRVLPGLVRRRDTEGQWVMASPDAMPAIVEARKNAMTQSAPAPAEPPSARADSFDAKTLKTASTHLKPPDEVKKPDAAKTPAEAPNKMAANDVKQPAAPTISHHAATL